MKKYQSTRDAFGEALIEFYNENMLVLSADLAGATRTNKFKALYPDQFIECGIAESNMIGIASGLSEYGYKIWLSSFGSFLTGRYDQIRCSLDYSDCKNVILVGTHSGLAIGKDGATQMGIEDINVLRALPNIQIFQPSCALETKFIVNYLNSKEFNGLAYLRLGRQDVSNINMETFSLKPYVYYEHKKDYFTNDVVIFNSGCLHELCMEVASSLSDFNVKIVNVPQLKPFQLEMPLNNKDLVVSIEDHSTIGGLGSILAEHIADNGINTKLLRIGIDTWPESGKPEDLYKKFGLNKKDILNRIYKCI